LNQWLYLAVLLRFKQFASINNKRKNVIKHSWLLNRARP
jgi:hypothetical protein